MEALEMNTKDENMVFNRIAEIQKSFNGLITEFGEKHIIEILNSQFGLSSQDSKQFFRITQKMVNGVPNDAIPDDWFFKPAPSQMRLGILKKRKSQIRRERDEIKYLIEQTRLLSDEVLKKLKDFWPKKYWDMLVGNKIYYLNKSYIVEFSGEDDLEGFDDDLYDDNHKLTSELIANNIIAERWNSTPSTIESYCK
jgi:hypothetical protein